MTEKVANRKITQLQQEMETQESCLNLSSSLKNAFFEDDSFLESNLESFSKSDLFQALKDAKNHNSDIERSNQKFKETIELLTNSLNEQKERCNKLERDKTFLRKNIQKASASWFERKAKLSESENECSSPEPLMVEEKETSISEKDEKIHKEGGHNFIAEETIQLFTDLKYKEEQLQLSEQRCSELNRRVKDYETVIDDQEVVIHGLEKQLDTYFNDNQKMSKQLVDMHRLFLDLEAINEKKVNAPPPEEDTTSTSTEHLPTSQDFKEMTGSVSKTYMKLKELIYEKKSLVTEIERLQTLNVELQNRVSQQELRLMNVSDALQTTWLLVSDLKDEHTKIHTAETILRYELKEKREVLNRLKNELECSREQWQFIRQRNSETEQEWANLREELNERRKLRKIAEMNGHNTITQEEIEGVSNQSKTSDVEFEPPIDLLVNMGIEYGVVDADEEETTTALALVAGEDVHENRLQNLEEQCCFLYQKLMTSTARALTLASRLTSLHQPYADSDEEYEEYDEENEEYYSEEYDENEDNMYETQMLSPDSESHDTAYVSEAEGADSTSGVPEGGAIVNEGDNELTEITRGDSPDLTDDNADVLSKRLINFLPRKIEILRASNERLEEKLKQQQEEKSKIEGTLNSAIEFERRQRRQLEQQLSHLGKCVDELKLERSGKIAQAEEDLKKKMEQVEDEKKDHLQMQSDFESLQEKFAERGSLLCLAQGQLEQTKKEAEQKITSLEETIRRLSEKRSSEDLCKSSQLITSSSPTGITEETRTSERGKNTEYDQCAARVRCGNVQHGNLSMSIREIALETEDTRLSEDSQLKQLRILTNCCLRIPFHLTTTSTLHWSCKVTHEQILFGIYYEESNQPTNCSTPEERNRENSFPSPLSTNLPIIQPLTTSTILGTAISQSRILLQPVLLESSSMSSNGRLVPKVPGYYSLVFQNLCNRNQEVTLRIWLQCDLKKEKSVVK